jgi:putative oxidoreductase
MFTTTWSPNTKQIGIALLLIRIAAGLAFIYHGAGILFGVFNGPGVDGFAAHGHYPLWVAYLVGLAQFCGGISVLTGIVARLGALAIVPVMVGAIYLVHWQHGFDSTKGGMEYALTQLLIALAILVAGAGPYSLVTLLRPAGRPIETGTGTPVTT